MATAGEERGPAMRCGESDAASLLGLPVGDYPHSRPPQAELPAAAKEQIQNAYGRLGLITL